MPVAIESASLSSRVSSPERTANRLGLLDTVSIIVGIVIGAGIYETAPRVLANVSSPSMALVAWSLGGALSLVGACCYAELASAYPNSGGDYVYLTRAYGHIVGFLFGWGQLTVVMTGSIGMMAYVFSDYAAAGFNLPSDWTSPLAAAVVVVLTLLNVVSVSVGKSAQNALSGLKLLGLGIVIATGFFAAPKTLAPASSAPTDGSLSLAMVLVLYTFGGWNDAAFIASEVRDRHKNLPRALLLGTLLITLVYLLLNSAFIAGLGFERARGSKAIATEVLSRAFGQFGASLMAALVMVSALGAVNGLIFTGSRIHASLGRDYRALAPLGEWHRRFDSPIHALLAQLAITLALIGVVGTEPGRDSVDWLLTAAGLQAVSWAGHGGFEALLRCTAPLFWGFFALSAISTIVLRWREPERERPFRVPFYPVLPIVFAATCVYMLYSSIQYAGVLTFVGLVPTLIGIPVYLSTRRPITPNPDDNAPSPLNVQKEYRHELSENPGIRQSPQPSQSRL